MIHTRHTNTGEQEKHPQNNVSNKNSLFKNFTNHLLNTLTDKQGLYSAICLLSYCLFLGLLLYKSSQMGL